jgi:DNA-binding MarR family transcriptional regulator
MNEARRSRSSPPRVITDLLSSRLHNLSGLSAASASLRVQRKFGLTLLEWRSIGMLGAFAPLSLKELASRAALDKSYASRTVGGLIERGIVVSERNDADGRGVVLSLTPQGQALYEKVLADAIARNERLLSPLNASQREQLMAMLSAVAVSARKVLEDEQRAANGEAIDDDEPAPTSPAARAARKAGAADDATLSEIRDLVSRLQQLVGGT